jgi:putative Mg2+ transporter-C (MgtC) family protein
MIKGVTTAATIFAAAAVGVVVGYGHLLVGTITAAMLLVTLELPHIPILGALDARRVAVRFANDPVYGPKPEETTVPEPDGHHPA